MATLRELVWNMQGGLGCETALEMGYLGDARKQLAEQRGPNLSELHHHVGKHVQESHHGVPEAAVRQALLVPGAGALGGKRAAVSTGRARRSAEVGGGGGVQSASPRPSGRALPGCTR